MDTTFCRLRGSGGSAPSRLCGAVRGVSRRPRLGAREAREGVRAGLGVPQSAPAASSPPAMGRVCDKVVASIRLILSIIRKFSDQKRFTQIAVAQEFEGDPEQGRERNPHKTPPQFPTFSGTVSGRKCGARRPRRWMTLPPTALFCRCFLRNAALPSSTDARNVVPTVTNKICGRNATLSINSVAGPDYGLIGGSSSH